MMLKNRILIAVTLLSCAYSYGQVNAYNYKRELVGVTEQWHSIMLPDDVFGKISDDLSDIRIYGITANNDTIETPYILKTSAEKILSSEVTFKIINRSYNDNGYYFTFEVPTKQPVNQINLDFSQENFDWRVKLEGSHNQQEWFTIVNNYRVLSIQNDETNFRFTKVVFPSSSYRYFRLLVPSREEPVLLSASILLYQTTNGVLKDHAVKSLKVEEKKNSKETVADVELTSSLPVCYLKIMVGSTFDYYRPVVIKCLTDSVESEQGWVYSYSTLTSGMLTSLDDNTFRFNSTTLRKLRIEVSNHDNAPLKIEAVEVKGYSHKLVARFTVPATYFLVYGNSGASKPQYDILEFTNRIPENLPTLTLACEQRIRNKIDDADQVIPIFRSKMWLWAVMVVMIAVLGWFTVKMIMKR